MSRSLRIEIIGAGVIGEATGRAFDEWGHNVVFKDIDSDVLDTLRTDGFETTDPEQSVEADLSVICVPTPYEGDEYNMDYVFDAISTLNEHTDLSDRTVVIHSTVLPGTTERIADSYNLDHVAMVPELLKQRQALHDALNHETVVIGATTERAYNLCKQAYEGRSEHLQCEPTEAELVKFASNFYAATKISFANELWRMARSLDVDPQRVESQFQSVSPWVSDEDGLTGGWPYGGACLPKDMMGLMSFFQNDLFTPVLHGAIMENRAMQHLDKQDETRDPQVPT